MSKITIGYDNECHLIMKSGNKCLKEKILASNLQSAKIITADQINGSFEILPHDFYANIFPLKCRASFFKNWPKNKNTICSAIRLRFYAKYENGPHEKDPIDIMFYDEEDKAKQTLINITDAIRVTLDRMVETGNVVTETDVISLEIQGPK